MEEGSTPIEAARAAIYRLANDNGMRGCELARSEGA
jgi:hypothetical protein